MKEEKERETLGSLLHTASVRSTASTASDWELSAEYLSVCLAEWLTECLTECSIARKQPVEDAIWCTQQCNAAQCGSSPLLLNGLACVRSAEQ